MAFEPNFEKITASYRKNLGSTQAQIDCKLPISDEVDRVVCSNAKAYVTNTEIVGKDINYTGYVSFQATYVNKNNEPMAMDYTAEFKETYPLGQENTLVPVVAVNVVDVKTDVVGGEIRVVAILESTIDAIYSETNNVLVDVAGDNFFTKKDLINYSTFAGVVQNKFDQTFDVEIKEGVNKVLSVCPSAYVDAVEVNDRFLTVKGGVCIDVCYVADNNMVRTVQNKFDITQEVASDDINVDSFVQSILAIAYNDIKITTSIDTDMAIVNVFLPMLYTGYVFTKNTTEIVTDLFSATHFTNINVNSMQNMQNYNELAFDDKIGGNVTIQDTEPFIDEVLGVCCGNIALANSEINDGNLVVEGVAHTAVLYQNKELDMICSVEVEMPFSLSAPVEYENNITPITYVSLCDVFARARRGKEIEVTANVMVYNNFFENNKDAVITLVTEEDEIPEEECALSIYLAKDGDTIWDIAKELRVSPEKVVEQNPDLSDPIAAGTRIVIYRQKQVEY